MAGIAQVPFALLGPQAEDDVFDEVSAVVRPLRGKAGVFQQGVELGGAFRLDQLLDEFIAGVRKGSRLRRMYSSPLWKNRLRR